MIGCDGEDSMILDWKNNPDHAGQYDILDAATFQPLPMEPPWRDVFYADDSRAILRLCKRDENGAFYFVNKEGLPIRRDSWRREKLNNYELPNAYVIRADGARQEVAENDMELAWEEVRRGILIVRKPDS
jgi:hypothetical protein